MKRITVLALSLLFALALAACAGNSTPETDPASDGDAEVTADVPEPQTMEYRSVTKVGPGNKLLYVNDLELNGCADPSVITVEENGRTCFYLYCTGIRGFAGCFVPPPPRGGIFRFRWRPPPRRKDRFASGPEPMPTVWRSQKKRRCLLVPGRIHRSPCTRA